MLFWIFYHFHESPGVESHSSRVGRLGSCCFCRSTTKASVRDAAHLFPPWIMYNRGIRGMKSDSSQLTKIADLGCNMFLCISFLPSSLYKLYSPRFAQVCSFHSNSPQAKIAFWRGKSLFISMKCSFSSMVWISHEFSFAKMDNFMSVVMWSQESAFSQFCFLWNLFLNLALSFC